MDSRVPSSPTLSISVTGIPWLWTQILTIYPLSKDPPAFCCRRVLGSSWVFRVRIMVSVTRPTRCIVFVISMICLIILSNGTRVLLSIDEARDHGQSEASVDWSKLAYGQYATNIHYLCNSVMIFDILHQLGSKADRLLLYASEMLSTPEATTADDDAGRLLIEARDQLGVKLSPISIVHRSTSDGTPHAPRSSGDD